MQPAIFSMQVALASLWRSWGVEPAAVVGHSLGEIAAAHVAGALSLEEAALVVCNRSRLMHATSGLGAMAAIGLPIQEVEKILEPFGNQVCIAALNAPESCTISGDRVAIDAILAQLNAVGVFCRPVRTEVACHSAQMAPLQEQLAATVAGLSPKTETVPLFSTLLGRQASGLEFGAVYWPRNLREPVRFAAAVGALLDEGYCRFIEVSPSPALVSSLRQNAQQRKIDIAATHSLRRAEDERSTLLNALGEIYVSGYDVDWQRLYPSGKFVAPPPYTWQRERFWFEQKGTSTPWGLAPVSHATKYSSHPLLGLRWESAHHPNTHFYEVEIDLKTLPFLGDHRADGTPIFPAAAYVEMALAASIEVFGPGPRVFRDVRFKSELFLSREQTARLQLVLTCDKPEQITFTFYSQETAEHGSSTWLEKATGQIDLSPLKKQPLPAQPLLAELLDQQYPLHVPGDQFYAGVAAGIEYGPAFHCVQHAWKGDNRAVTSIALPEATHADAKRYHLPPVLLDGFLHSIYACSKRGSRTSLPFEMSRMEIWRLPNPATHLWCELTLEKNATECESFLTIFDDSGEVLIRINRYRSKFLETKKAADKEEPERWLYERQWRVAPRQQARVLNGSWLIVGGPERAATELKQALEAQQQACVLIARGADFASALREFKLSGKAPGIIFFEALDLPANPEISLSALDRSVEHTCGSLLQLLHGLAGTEWLETPRLFVVTRNAQEVGTEPRPIAIAQAPLVGMARVAAVEHREFQITQIDTEAETAAGTIAQEVLFADQEMEVALRNGQRWGVRLVRPNLAERSRTETFRIGPEAQKSFQLEAAGTGLLDDLKLRGAARRSPEPGEVEIHVKAVGLNFLDVLKALNMAPGLPSDALYFGMECAGVVVAVGDGVERLRVGDEVVALDSTITGCFRAFFTTRADSVFSKPAHLSLEEAVTIPVAYQTAYYALCYLGRMQKGESVLIHSAAGGVGMAALDLARQTGAVIFATAGTQEKRDLLRQLGAHYVMDSHSLRFADEVMQHTQGRGVDLVLNSLAGEAIPKSLSVLATGGRFLEIGKRDIYADSRIGLLPFQRNLSFFAIDLLRMRLEKPEVVQSLTREVAQRLADGTFKPLPYTRFPASSVADAFRYMAQGKHTGKIVVTLDDGTEVKVETTAEPVPIRADAAYLITGGTGGLGLVFARRLVAQGARNLVLVSRRGPSPEAEEQINSLRAEGANILTIKADISDPEQVSAVLAQIESSGLPLKGVLHLAGVLNDGILQQQTWEKFQSVLPPKIAGAWNLHSQLSNTQLDFFVLFSSAASVLGGAGQSNYAAGNAFLDALAFYRRQSGLAALSINWGPWADVGMAAMKEDRGSRLAENGMGSIPLEEGAELLDTLLQQPSPQVAVMPIDWEVWAERFPDLLRLPILSELADDLKPAASQSGEQSVQQMVAAAGTQTEALELLQAYLRKETAKILRVPEARLDPKVSLIRFGLDSLMAIELKNRIETSFAVRLATTKLLQGPTVTELAEWLSKEVRGGEPAAATAAPVRKTTEMSVRVEELSEEEVDSMLKDFLTAGGDA
jgi:epothilone polyketide synthase D